MKRLVLASFAVAALLAITVSTALAQWPTSCVELNDIIEAQQGNHENVGIYQRVHDDSAEAACRLDHQRDGFFGARRYEIPLRTDDPAGYTQFFVERAIERYKTQGLQATLDFYNSSASVEGQWYLFVADANDVMIAHGVSPELLGQSYADIRGPDGYPAGLQVVRAATEAGAWTTYTWVNPTTGGTQRKHSWAVRHDGLLFGSGWYEPGPSKDNPAAYAQALVRQAVTLFETVGGEAAIAYYNLPESADGPWYVFVLDDRDSGLYTVAHPVLPKVVGTTRGRIDANGFNFGEAFAAVTEESGGAWVSYVFTRPQTGEDAPKHSWLVRRGNLLFGSGWYER